MHHDAKKNTSTATASTSADLQPRNGQVSATVTSTTGNGSTNPVLNPYAGVLTNNAIYASDTSLIATSRA